MRVGDAAVDLYELDNDRWDSIDDTTTAPDGTYSFALPPGSYASASRTTSDDYIAEYYDDADDVEDANTVVVPDGGRPQSNVVLAPAAHLTGTVTGPDGARLGGRVASRPPGVGRPGWDQLHGVGRQHRRVGNYDIGGLPGRRLPHRVRATILEPGDPTATRSSGTTTGPTATSRHQVTVAAVQTLAAIDAELGLDSEISGVVHDAADADPAANVDSGTPTRSTTVPGGRWRRTSSRRARQLRPRRAGCRHLLRAVPADFGGDDATGVLERQGRVLTATDSCVGERRGRHRRRSSSPVSTTPTSSDRRQHRAPDDLRHAVGRVAADRIARHVERPSPTTSPTTTWYADGRAQDGALVQQLRPGRRRHRQGDHRLVSRRRRRARLRQRRVGAAPRP